MSSAAVPEPWASRMVERGFTDPRYRQDVPSMSSLAAVTNLHTSTISGLIHGRRRPSTETVGLLVEALGPDVADWLGYPRPSRWDPPAEADLLTDRQQKALTELIRAFASGEQEEVVGDERDTAPKSEPSPAGDAGQRRSTAIERTPDPVQQRPGRHEHEGSA